MRRFPRVAHRAGRALVLPAFVLVAASACRASEALPPTAIGAVEVSGDWAFGCDNIGACEAVSLGGEEEGDAPGGLGIALYFADTPGPLRATLAVLARPVDEVDSEEAAQMARPADVASFRVGHKLYHLGDIDEDQGTEEPHLRYLAPPAFLDALVQARSLELLDRKGGMLGSISARGLGDALAHVRQVRREMPAGARVPAPFAFDQPPPFDSLGETGFSPAMAVAWQQTVGCPELDMDLAERPLSYQAYPLEPGVRLVTISCAPAVIGSGDDPNFYIPVIYDARHGTSEYARFDMVPGGYSLGGTLLVPDTWLNDEDGQLRTLGLRRTLGDCGTMMSYVWRRDTREFVLVHASAMPSCRGAGEFIRTYFRPAEMRPR
ncbi:MAG: hypothetical protein IE933_09235 [Sphingomonadales bacterium]|nr:hypothetical protein [Sphingomonadales bacterium]MBD3772873.1 hypothetical protein [Paracoccaceae bacterium]